MPDSVLDRPRFLDLDGLRVACYESGGSAGPGILLVHGNSSSAGAYRAQLEGPLGERLRLVALDLPGHGRSDRATRDPAAIYRSRGYAEVVAEIADRLGLARGVVVGWSLGGDIVLQAMAGLPKAAGFLIFGTGPLAKPFDPRAFIEGSVGALGIQGELSEEEQLAYGTAFFRPGAADIPEPVFADIAATDPAARKYLGASLLGGDYEDEVVLLERADRPVAILHGIEEQFVSLDFLRDLRIPSLWQGAVQTVEGAGHALQIERPDEFDQLLERFARDVG